MLTNASKNPIKHKYKRNKKPSRSFQKTSNYPTHTRQQNKSTDNNTERPFLLCLIHPTLFLPFFLPFPFHRRPSPPPHKDQECHAAKKGMISYLQGLAANKLGPPAHLGWDALGTRKLLAHALGKEHGRLCYLVSIDITIATEGGKLTWGSMKRGTPKSTALRRMT